MHGKLSLKISLSPAINVITHDSSRTNQFEVLRGCFTLG